MKAKERIQRLEQITSITAYYCPLRIAKLNPVCSYTSESQDNAEHVSIKSFNHMSFTTSNCDFGVGCNSLAQFCRYYNKNQRHKQSMSMVKKKVRLLEDLV